MDFYKPNRHNDIPYELRMKYIIRDYLKLLKAKDTLTSYAKRLEQENEELKEERSRQGFVNKQLGEKKVELRRKCKRLEVSIEYMQKRINQLTSFIQENGLTPPEAPNPNDEQL